MTSKSKKRDPLSRYFKDLDECDLESGESDAEEDRETESEENKQVPTKYGNSSAHSVVNRSEPISTTKAKATTEIKDDISNGDSKKTNKLPSAHECLKSQSNPSFLKLGDKKEVNWDSHHKQLTDGDDESVPDFERNAVPPPSSYEPVTDPGIKVVDSEGKKRKTFDDLEDQMTSTKAFKVHKEEDS